MLCNWAAKTGNYLMHGPLGCQKWKIRCAPPELWYHSFEMGLTEEQFKRYSRHIILDKVGGRGQEKLLASKVLIVGAGGLGSSAGLYLAATGVGTLGLVDADRVDLSNLQRQVIHQTKDIGIEKVVSAANTLRAINPDITIETHAIRATARTITNLIQPYDFVIDGTDNFATKFLINDACYLTSIPFSHAGILRFYGHLLTVLPGQSNCCRCVYGGPPPAHAVPSCAQAGVLGVLPGVIGSLQATEAIKYLLGIGDLLTDTLLLYDGLNMEFKRVALKKNSKCPLCGENPGITELQDEEPSAACDPKN
jgi:molybdopterin/thiamine biosynthesis adenylyltransferase